MKVLVVIKGPTQRFLVKLHNGKLVNDVKKLIDKNRHEDAMSVALCRGTVEREVDERDISGLEADLILSEEGLNSNGEKSNSLA